MYVLRAPCIVVIAPRIRARLHRHEAISPAIVSHHFADSREVRIERRFVLVAVVSIAARSVGLPNFDQAMGNRAPVFVEHAAGYDDTFAERFSAGKVRQVGVAGADNIRCESWAGDLGQRLLDCNRLVPRRSLVRAPPCAILAWRMKSG